MVWFQCEDCGENLKKPKLQNHFRVCSAFKLSCIDCGEIFTKQSVQSHTQCISEAEKYGPKNQVKASNGTPAKPKSDSKPNLDIDINVGLSSRPPWFCGLCNTYTTSQQTLLSHAEGKKHRAKARAFHAKQQPIQAQEISKDEKDCNKKDFVGVAVNGNCNTTNVTVGSIPETDKESTSLKKRKLDASTNGLSKNKACRSAVDSSNGEVIPAGREESESLPKKSKNSDATLPAEDQVGEVCCEKEASDQKIKWKKLITSILKSNPDGVLKMRKLRKLASKALEESGIILDDTQLQDILECEITSSSRFVVDNKLVRLAT